MVLCASFQCYVMRYFHLHRAPSQVHCMRSCRPEEACRQAEPLNVDRSVHADISSAGVPGSDQPHPVHAAHALREQHEDLHWQHPCGHHPGLRGTLYSSNKTSSAVTAHSACPARAPSTCALAAVSPSGSMAAILEIGFHLCQSIKSVALPAKHVVHMRCPPGVYVSALTPMQGLLMIARYCLWHLCKLVLESHHLCKLVLESHLWLASLPFGSYIQYFLRRGRELEHIRKT